MKTCPKCNATMEEGFIVDRTYGKSQPMVETWVEGAPEISFWTGLKMRGKEKLEVATYRCEGCGYLESYALKAVE